MCFMKGGYYTMKNKKSIAIIIGIGVLFLFDLVNGTDWKNRRLMD